MLTRQGQTQAAAESFTKAIEQANIILSLTDGLYRVIYARALSHAGLSLLHQYDLLDTQADYEHAMAVCSAAGVVQANRDLLHALMQSDEGGSLAPLLDLLQV
ncbi:hypothetical protein HC776_00775 [bacterium]|nr:hypothetical protein [bacterium]